jgi:dihydrofolate reductase
MIRSLIVARARNGVIGRDNALPWHLPADLAHFRRTTLGHPVIMGRRTWESIGRPLPGRENLVVSRRAGYSAPGARVVQSLEEAWRTVAGAGEAFVIGGAGLYEAALPGADRIYLTEIEADVEGDTRFPALQEGDWIATIQGEHGADERNAFGMRFVLLSRRETAGVR